MESVLAQVPPQQVDALGKVIVSEMIRQKLYIGSFALSRLTLSETANPAQRAAVIGRMENDAALLKRFGTRKQQESLQKAALAMLRKRGEGSLVERVSEFLVEIFPET